MHFLSLCDFPLLFQQILQCFHIVVVQSLSRVPLFGTPRIAARQVSPSFTISQSLLKFMSAVSMMPSNQIIFCPLSPPTLNLSQRQGLSCPVSRLFTSGGQNIWASASASVLPMNIQGWFPLGLTILISLLSKRFSRVFSSTVIQKHQFFSAQSSLRFNCHICTWLLQKP